MPRARRSASPVRRPASPPPQSRQPAPVQQQPSAMQAQPSRGPGMMAQMASTAGGVAIGSVVGHGISSALFGGGSSGGSSEVADAAPQPPPQYQQQPPQYQQQQQQPQICGWELQQFLNCAQNQQDISLCDGFNEALKQCKRNNGYMG